MAATASMLSLQGLLVLVPRLLAAASIFLLNLLLIRVVDPAVFGVFAFATTCVLMIDGLAGAALDMGVVRQASLEKTSGKVELTPAERNAILLKTGVGAILITTSLVCGGLLSRIMPAAGDPVIWALIASAGTLLLLFRSLLIHLQLNERTKRYATLDLTHTLLRFAFMAVALITGLRSPVALLSAWSLATVVVLVWGAIPVLQAHTAGSWFAAKEWNSLLTFTGAAVVTALVGTVVARLDTLIFASVGSPAQLGIYTAALAIAAIPEYLGSYLSVVFSPKIMPYCREGRFYSFYVRFQTVFALLCVAAGILTLWFLEPAVSLLFPPRYQAAVPVLALLIPAALTGLYALPLTLHFLMFHKPLYLAAFDCASVFLLIPFYLYAGQSGDAVTVARITLTYRIIKLLIIQAAAFRLAYQLDRKSRPIIDPFRALQDIAAR